MPSCAEGGVLGVLPGVIGTIQATETIKLLLGGGSTLIAVELHLSDKTVKNYLSHAFEKLNVTRRAQAAVLFAQINGSVRSAS